MSQVYMNYDNFPTVGTLGVTYIAMDTGESWIWTGSAATGSYTKKVLNVSIPNNFVFQGTKTK
jgi:hypothetical protein